MNATLVRHGPTASELIVRIGHLRKERPALTPAGALNVALSEHPVSPDVVSQVLSMYKIPASESVDTPLPVGEDDLRSGK